MAAGGSRFLFEEKSSPNLTSNGVNSTGRSSEKVAKSNDAKLSISPKSQYLADRVERPIFHRRHLKPDEVKQAEKEVKINNAFNLLVRFKEQMELDKDHTNRTCSINM